jgi:hypothetical protein
MTARSRLVVVALIATLGASSCGLPGAGSVRTVDEGDVPYRLLEPEIAPVPIETEAGAQVRVPAVFWVDGERLLPTATGDVCADEPEVLSERLLGALVAGPSEDARSRGRSSAVPAEFGLELTGVDGETVTIDLQPHASLSAEQLPVAIGQIVLTVTTVPSIRSVVLTSDDDPLQVPLPEGALTEDPVTARDYVELLPVRLRGPSAVGCPRS